MIIIIIQICLIAFYFLLGIIVLAQKTLAALLSQRMHDMTSRSIRVLSGICLVMHAFVIVHPWVFLDGLPLSLSYSFSTMMFVALVIESGVSMPARIFFPALQVALFFMSALSVGMSVYAAPYTLSSAHMAYRGLLKTHLLLAIVAASLIIIAFFHAFAVMVKEYRLRHLRFMNEDQLPSLLWLERIMFSLFRWSLLLIALAMLSGAAVLTADPRLCFEYTAVKYALSGLIWLLIAILLWGRHRFGWRGSKIALSFVMVCLLFFLLYLQAIYHVLPIF